MIAVNMADLSPAEARSRAAKAVGLWGDARAGLQGTLYPLLAPETGIINSGKPALNPYSSFGCECSDRRFSFPGNRMKLGHASTALVPEPSRRVSLQ